MAGSGRAPPGREELINDPMAAPPRKTNGLRRRQMSRSSPPLKSAFKKHYEFAGEKCWSQLLTASLRKLNSVCSVWLCWETHKSLRTPEEEVCRPLEKNKSRWMLWVSRQQTFVQVCFGSLRGMKAAIKSWKYFGHFNKRFSAQLLHRSLGQHKAASCWTSSS